MHLCMHLDKVQAVRSVWYMVLYIYRSVGSQWVHIYMHAYIHTAVEKWWWWGGGERRERERHTERRRERGEGCFNGRGELLIEKGSRLRP